MPLDIEEPGYGEARFTEEIEKTVKEKPGRKPIPPFLKEEAQEEMVAQQEEPLEFEGEEDLDKIYDLDNDTINDLFIATALAEAAAESPTTPEIRALAKAAIEDAKWKKWYREGIAGEKVKKIIDEIFSEE